MVEVVVAVAPVAKADADMLSHGLKLGVYTLFDVHAAVGIAELVFTRESSALYAALAASKKIHIRSSSSPNCHSLPELPLPPAPRWLLSSSKRPKHALVKTAFSTSSFSDLVRVGPLVGGGGGSAPTEVVVVDNGDAGAGAAGRGLRLQKLLLLALVLYPLSSLSDEHSKPVDAVVAGLAKRRQHNAGPKVDTHIAAKQNTHRRPIDSYYP